MGAKIYNSNLTKELIEGARLQQNQSGIPSEIAEKVIPVMEVNPKLLRITNYSGLINGTATGNITAVTSATKETYITDLVISVIKDVVCDVTTGRIQLAAVINGQSINLASIAVIALTAQNINLSISLVNPLKVDLGSTITFTGAFTAGVMSRSVVILGYTIDNITA
jgi:hypothetical protein